MKKFIFLLTTAIAMTAFTSFKMAPPATVIDLHQDISGPFFTINSCNGEFVTLDGTLSEDIHEVLNGNRVNFSEHIHASLHGTGDQGNEYNLTDNVSFTENFSLNNGQVAFDEIQVFNVISKGSAPNFKARVKFHVTVNANGTVTSSVSEITTTCNG